VPIARTPEEALPDATLLNLLSRLARIESLRVAIVSGRSLASLRTILPVPKLILAGIYGAEIQMGGQITTRVADPMQTRRKIVEMKSVWAKTIARCDGIWLEDKGLALALHARFADPNVANSVLPHARRVAEEAGIDGWRILGGERFLELAPASANKGETVNWLLDNCSNLVATPVASLQEIGVSITQAALALPVYLGDDDKDEEAFAVIRARGGIAIAVGARQLQTHVDARLPSPDAARSWLQSILAEVDPPDNAGGED